MTPKDKAVMLINRYASLIPFYNFKDNLRKAKIAASIAANEVYSEVSDNHAHIGRNHLTDKEFWKEVLNEIDKYEG